MTQHQLLKHHLESNVKVASANFFPSPFDMNFLPFVSVEKCESAFENCQNTEKVKQKKVSRGKLL